MATSSSPSPAKGLRKKPAALVDFERVLAFGGSVTLPSAVVAAVSETVLPDKKFMNEVLRIVGSEVAPAPPSDIGSAEAKERSNGLN